MRQIKLVAYVSVLIVGLWSMVPRAHGQTTFGQITGTVMDPSGAVVPGADRDRD